VTIRGERGITRLYRTPPTGFWETADAIDSGIVMRELDSNSAHFCQESVRHLATDSHRTALFAFSTVDWNNGRALQAQDVIAPSVDDIQFTRQGLAWDKRSALRYGPFTIVPDEGNKPVEAQPRAVRLVAQVRIAAGLDRADACAVMTRGSSPREIFAGEALAVNEQNGLASGLQTLRFDLVPDPNLAVDAAIRPSLVLPSANNSGGVGAVRSSLRQYFIWLGFVLTDSAPVSACVVRGVSVYERRV